MAFTLDQNVQGAGAFEQPIQAPASTGLALAGNLLDGLDTFARGQLAQDRAMATAARANLPTQTERDRAAFANIIQSAQQDISGGMARDQAAANYAVDLANLGLNDEQTAVASRVFGQGVFTVPVQPVSAQDTATTLFNNQGEGTRLGLINIALKEAEANGETITYEQATTRAVGSLASNVAQAQAAVVAGNLNYSSGFAGNMETLERFGSTLSAALDIEISGGNFRVEEIVAYAASFAQLRSQPAFMRPAGDMNAELWGQMETKIASIDRMFETITNYDQKVASTKATAYAANIALNLSEKNPIAILAMKSPEFMVQIAAQIAPKLAIEMADSGNVLNNVVGFSDLNFDPAITALAGSEGTTAGQLAAAPEIFPTELTDASRDIEGNEAEVAKNLTIQSSLLKDILSDPAEVLADPNAKEAWASVISNMSNLLMLRGLETNSTTGLDSLFAPSNLRILRDLEGMGGKDAETATILKAQMTAALQKNAANYAVNALGRIKSIPQITIDPDTLSFELSTAPEYQFIQGVVNQYYGGDFNALWKEGPTAFNKLQNRLAATGQITQDSPEYESFLAATKGINPSEPESLIWRSLSTQYSKVSSISTRLRQLRSFERALNVDSGIADILDDTSDALRDSTVEARIARGEIVTTNLPPAETTPVSLPPSSWTGSGTEEDPIVFTEQTGMTYEMFQAVPAEAYYVDPTGLKSQKRADSRVTNEDIGDGDPLGSGTFVRDFSTPGSKEEYDVLPSGARWIDPDGNRRTKP